MSEFRDIPGVLGFRVNTEGEFITQWEWGGRGRYAWKRVTEEWRPFMPNPSGAYLAIGVGQLIQMYAHAAVLEAFVGPCPAGMQCRHLDGNPHNNKLDNLKWGTQGENELDKRNHGRTGGMPLPCDADTAEEIRKRYATGGVTQQRLAIEYGVSQNFVSRVIRGLTRV